MLAVGKPGIDTLPIPPLRSEIRDDPFVTPFLLTSSQTIKARLCAKMMRTGDQYRRPISVIDRPARRLGFEVLSATSK